jgi:hypothetical protein
VNQQVELLLASATDKAAELSIEPNLSMTFLVPLSMVDPPFIMYLDNIANDKQNQ